MIYFYIILTTGVKMTGWTKMRGQLLRKQVFAERMRSFLRIKYGGTMEYYETKLDGETKYKGVIVEVTLDHAALHTGEQVKREVVHHPGGVTVLPVDENGGAYALGNSRHGYRQWQNSLHSPRSTLSLLRRDLRSEYSDKRKRGACRLFLAAYKAAHRAANAVQQSSTSSCGQALVRANESGQARRFAKRSRNSFKQVMRI